MRIFTFFAVLIVALLVTAGCERRDERRFPEPFRPCPCPRETVEAGPADAKQIESLPFESCITVGIWRQPGDKFAGARHVRGREAEEFLKWMESGATGAKPPELKLPDK